MDFNDNYLDATAEVISEMHVLIEGTIAIFENDTAPLIRLCTQHKELEARMAAGLVFHGEAPFGPGLGGMPRPCGVTHSSVFSPEIATAKPAPNWAKDSLIHQSSPTSLPH